VGSHFAGTIKLNVIRRGCLGKTSGFCHRSLVRHRGGSCRPPAITGHKTLVEVERYTPAADQERLARQAIQRRSENRSGKPLVDEVADTADGALKINSLMWTMALPRGIEPSKINGVASFSYWKSHIASSGEFRPLANMSGGLALQISHLRWYPTPYRTASPPNRLV
jgi:hypothetical protein